MAKRKKRKEERKYRFFWEEPLEEVERMRHELEEAFKSFWSEPFRFELTIPRITFPKFGPTARFRETDKELIIHIPLPGFKRDEIELTVTENYLRVRAEKKEVRKEQTESAYFASAAESKIERSYRLPKEIVPERVRAKLEDGVLTIVAPKAKPERKERRVKIE